MESEEPSLEFSREDESQLRAHGVEPADARRQIELLHQPPAGLKVLRPATVDDGIERLDGEKCEQLRALWRSSRARAVKFVPASGAASRMFSRLLQLAEHLGEDGSVDSEPSGDSVELEAGLSLLENRQRWPFDFPYVEGDDLQLNLRRAFEHLFGAGTGLELHRLPKALLPFHRLTGSPTCAATAFEDQLHEGLAYLGTNDGTCRYHFTVHAAHRPLFDEALARLAPEIEQECGKRLEVGFSSQSSSTDTLAVTQEGELLRDHLDSLVLRPGGHGALLQNLERIAREADCVFVKNIDNVLPRHLQQEVIEWKEVLGGKLLAVRSATLAVLEELEQSVSQPEKRRSAISAAHAFQLCAFGPVRPELPNYSETREAPEEASTADVEAWIEALDRPLRVCGMVRNEGRPGGGPFWVEPAHSGLQIVESAEFAPAARQALEKATHFNPVDIALCTLDRRGKPHDLRRFVDPQRVFVAHKSSGSEHIKALERPGLWNGAMAYWNTVFVEVPASTFAPVKTVFDLLDPAHQT
jgi:hypothetical protein